MNYDKVQDVTNDSDKELKTYVQDRQWVQNITFNAEIASVSKESYSYHIVTLTSALLLLSLEFPAGFLMSFQLTSIDVGDSQISFKISLGLRSHARLYFRMTHHKLHLLGV